MTDLATLQGILALVDVVNFTPQADKLGEKYTAQYTAYFQEKIKTIVTKYKFRVVKDLGDAVLVFGISPEGLLEIMLDLFERDKPNDNFGFISRFRLVAHSGYFQFRIKYRRPVDLVSPEGIKVFRLEKHAVMGTGGNPSPVPGCNYFAWHQVPPLSV
jgi:class 3 adenylate cyclase